MVVYLTEYTTRGGRKRTIRLYRAWKNLLGRVAGRNCAGDGSRPWAGLPNNFVGWRQFRSWALDHGYCREKNSLDRVNPDGGYGPSNCQWLSVSENTRKQNLDNARERLLYPEGVRMVSNEWTEERRWLGVPF